MEEFLTVEFLATFVGLVAATSIFVQFTKSLIKKSLGDEFVRLYTFAIALILSFVFANNGYDVQSILLTIINAIIISTSANGAYEIVSDPLAKKTK